MLAFSCLEVRSSYAFGCVVFAHILLTLWYIGVAFDQSRSIDTVRYLIHD